MELNQEDIKAGWSWFFRAGLAAIALSVALAWIDMSTTNSNPKDGVTASDYDKRSTKILSELRMAQTSVKTGASDPRQLGSE